MYKTPLERTLFYNIKIILKNESNFQDIYRNIFMYSSLFKILQKYYIYIFFYKIIINSKVSQ